MWTCPNCKAQHSCGCASRKAPDGTQACTACVGKFRNTTQVSSFPTPERVPGSITPVINRIIHSQGT